MQKQVNQFLRRILDVVGSFTALILLSPLFLLIAILIKRDSHGPVIYRGLRVGLHGRKFNILKFRTMYETARSYGGSRVTGSNDPRITPVGQWLRATKINELPQFWNVLVGDMSLVGPRPEDPEIVATWPHEIKQELLSMRPGITSPASVLYRNEESLLTSSNVMDDYLRTVLPSKLRLDLLYVRNHNLIIDLDILVWTLVALLPQLKEKQIPENLLFWGLLSRFLSRYFVWFIVDIPVAFLAVSITGIIWRTAGPLELGVGPAAGVALALALLFSIANSILGLNRISWSSARTIDSLDLAISSGLVTLILFAINGFLLEAPLLPQSMLITSGLLAFFGFSAVRYRSRLITGIGNRWLANRISRNGLGERVLIIGAGSGGGLAAWLVRNGGFARAFSIVGIADDDPRKQGMKYEGYRVLGTTNEIPQIVKRYDIGLILFAISDIDSLNRQRILSLCDESSARCLLFSDFIDALRNQFLHVTQASESREIFTKSFIHINGYIDSGLVKDWLEELKILAQLGSVSHLQRRLGEISAAIENTQPVLVKEESFAGVPQQD